MSATRFIDSEVKSIAEKCGNILTDDQLDFIRYTMAVYARECAWCSSDMLPGNDEVIDDYEARHGLLVADSA